MKQTLLLLIALCFSLTLYGQERETVQERRERLRMERRDKSTNRNSNIIYKEYGFNMASILQSVPILPVGRDGFPNYVLFFKRKKTGKEKTFRFHAAGSLGGVEFAITSFELKLGMEYPRPLTNGWEYYYGYDFLTFVQNRGSEAGIGAGPIFGMRYNLNDFISFGTEGSAYLTISGGSSSSGSAINLRPLNGLLLVSNCTSKQKI